MAIGAFVYGNYYRQQRDNGNFDWDTDVIKVMIMNTGFTFDPDTHDQLANVSASELANGNGYTIGGATLANVTITRDNANNRSDKTADQTTWDASGGNIGPFSGFLYINTTRDVIVGFLPVSPDETVAPPVQIQLDHPTFRND